MAILLSLETSTGICSAALHENGKLLDSMALDIPKSASSKLTVMVNDLLKSCDLPCGAIDGVAVAAGPGSYTGLRIGVATAKGLCFALNVRLISINTLELLTYQVISSPFFSTQPARIPSRVNEEGPVLCALLDARRMEVYYLLSDTRLNVLEVTAAKIIDEHSFEEWLAKGRVLFFGNGTEKCEEVIRHPHATFIHGIHPTASMLGELAFRKFEANAFEKLSSFEPFYLKDFMIKKPKIKI